MCCLRKGTYQSKACMDLGAPFLTSGSAQAPKKRHRKGRYPGEQGQVHVAVRKLLAFYGPEVGSITTTGHSLGGALASICAFDLVRAAPHLLRGNGKS